MKKNLLLGISIALVVILMLAAISDNLTGFVSKNIKKSKIKSA